jgi:hypothetical protein
MINPTGNRAEMGLEAVFYLKPRVLGMVSREIQVVKRLAPPSRNS